MYVLEVSTDLDRTIRKVFHKREDAETLHENCLLAMYRGKFIGSRSQRQLLVLVRLLRADTDSVWDAESMAQQGLCKVLHDSEADKGKSIDELLEQALCA